MTITTERTSAFPAAAPARRLNEHGIGISESQVWRICQALDLKPWQTESWMTSHDPDFWEKCGDVCGLYLNPPENRLVWSVDEKTGIQAKSRVNPTKPARRGTRTRRAFDYVRNGTVKLYAGFQCPRGHGRRLGHRLDRLGELRRLPRAPWRPDPQRDAVALHHGQLELWFSIIERRLIRHGEFTSVQALTDRIIAFIHDYNRRAKPFRWTSAAGPSKSRKSQ
jgi:hypothetical protein